MGRSVTASNPCQPVREAHVNPAETDPMLYEVYQLASTGQVVMRAGGVQVAITNYNVSGRWNTDWDYEYFGEVWHIQTRMPGTPTNKVKFKSLRWMDSAGNYSWAPEAAMTGNITGSVVYKYCREPINGQPSGEFRIWTAGAVSVPC